MANLLDLMTQMRLRLDDFGGDTELWKTDDSGCLWGNAELASYLGQAEAEHARRTGGIADSRSYLTRLTVTAGLDYYPLDPRVLSLQRVSLDGVLLEKRFQDDLDAAGPVTGVLYYQEDQDAQGIRLIAKPNVDGLLSLMVKRLPLAPLAWEDAEQASVDEPEINVRFHEDLLEWAASLAYLKQDADTQDFIRASTARKRFEERTGPSRGAYLEGIDKVKANTRLRVRSTFW